MVDWFAEKLNGAVRDLERIQAGEAPTAQDLVRAPTLHRWRPVRLRNPDGAEAVVLSGTVTGHPDIPPGPATTSMIVAIDPGERWARTLSRWYRLSGKAEDRYGP